MINKILKNALLAILGLSCNSTYAQVEKLVSIDPYTGIHTVIGDIPTVQVIVNDPNYTTYDDINGRFIFRGTDESLDWSLYSVDVNTGNIESNPLFPNLSDDADAIIELQMDNSTGILYGLHWDDSQQVISLASIDPATGEYDIIGSIPDVKSVSTLDNFTTFDQINGHFIFKGADANINWALYSIDVNTGNVVASPSFPVLGDTGVGNVIELQMDNSTGALYALHWDANLQTEFLVSVDRLTGVHKKISSIPGVQWIAISPHFTTFDHINGNFIFKGGDAYMNFKLYSVNVHTGDIVANPFFPLLEDPNDNIVELQFDNTTGVLYGLHWDADVSTTSIDDLSLENLYKIYPNPFHEKTTIELDAHYDNIVLNIFDSQGKLVRKIEQENINKIDLYKGELSPGIYFINIEGKGLNTVQKLIIK